MRTESVGMRSLSGWRGRWYVGRLTLSLVRVVQAWLLRAAMSMREVRRDRRCIRSMRRRCTRGIPGSGVLDSGSRIRRLHCQLSPSPSLRMGRRLMWEGRSRWLYRSSSRGVMKAPRGRSRGWKRGRAHLGRQHRQGRVLLLRGCRPSRSRRARARVLVGRLLLLLQNQTKEGRRRRGDFH